MKHIIVIETADGVDGQTPHPIPEWLEESIQQILEDYIEDRVGLCAVQTRFNVSSAIAAVHEMYGAPVWDPNDIPSRAPEPACEWYGRLMGQHSWVDTVDGHQRCEKCKNERIRP